MHPGLTSWGTASELHTCLRTLMSRTKNAAVAFHLALNHFFYDFLVIQITEVKDNEASHVIKVAVDLLNREISLAANLASYSLYWDFSKIFLCFFGHTAVTKVFLIMRNFVKSITG